jgi:hypothetical protein
MNSEANDSRESDKRPQGQYVAERRGGDRRNRCDRRRKMEPVADERRKRERREGERRRQVDPATCERVYDDEELEFMLAMDEYKRKFGRPFPTWSEVLEVVKSLGYRKVADRTPIPTKRPLGPAETTGDL